MGRFWEIMQRWFGGPERAAFRGDGSVERGVECDRWKDEVMGYRVWYCGDEAELQRFYEMGDDGVGNTSFWASRGSNGIGFRKIHSGLPALVVDKLADVVCGDLVKVQVKGEGEWGDVCDDVWQEIWDENGLGVMLRRAVREVLVCGDGAFKINVDAALSGLPVIEFVGGDRVDYEYVRGRLKEVRFKTELESEAGKGKKERFILTERYGYGYVRYELVDENGRAVGLDTLEATEGLLDVEYERKLMMAVPLKFDENGRFAGRGKSLFDGKTGLFDGLDEVVSQWVDCLRAGRPNVYIPSVLLPRNPNTGAVLKPNGFDSRYIQTQGDLAEGADNRIEVVQPDIQTEALMDSYMVFLDLCLQGVIAPSTIGVDVSKKRDNAEAQREREKATIYTRNRLIDGLRRAVVLLAQRAIGVWELMYEKEHCDVEVSVSFGEYANPGFEAQVETIGRAVGFGIMSLETALDELYGDSWSEEDKRKESVRLRELQNKKIGGVLNE